MANSLYNIGREGFLTEITVGAFTGKIDWTNDNIRVALLDDTYVFDAAHTDYSDIADAVVADEPLSNLTTNGAGTAMADNVTFSSVTGNEVVSLVIYRSDGAAVPDTAANCPLIAFIDSVTAGLPVTPNGGDITILWNGGTGEIFVL